MSEGRMCGHKAHIDPLEQCADTIDPRPRSPYLLSKLEPLKCWLICHNSDAAPPSLRGDQAQASPLRQPDDPQLPMATDQQLPEQTDNSALFRPLTPASIAAQRANAGQHNVDKVGFFCTCSTHPHPFTHILTLSFFSPCYNISIIRAQSKNKQNSFKI